MEDKDEKKIISIFKSFFAIIGVFAFLHWLFKKE
jgi:flagellar biogenesis protein FliO